MSVSVPHLRAWAIRLEASGNKSAVISAMCEETGWSRARCYRALSGVGYVSGRKPRCDKSHTKADALALEKIAAMLHEGVRKTGTQTMHVTTARSILESHGICTGVSTSTIRRILKAQHMDTKSLCAEKAHVRLRSAHPNYLHQVDPSLCILYYGSKGKQCVMHRAETHRNKFENTAKKLGNKKLWRYVLVDHYSASIVCKYYEAGGENQYNLWDFLLYAWGKKRMSHYVMHGVPKYLLWDAGSANTSRSVQRALDMLGVEDMTHMPGNPRAKGSVETGNRIIETQFESRIYSQPSLGVGELNESVEHFCAGWNNNTLAHYDSSLRRGDKRGIQRTGLWLRIRAEQLRVLPDEKLCRGLLTHEAVERAVAGDLSISYKHPRQRLRRIYDVRHVEGVYRGAKIEVQPLVVSEQDIVVSVAQLDGTVVRSVVHPLVFDETGFAETAAMIGEEYKSVADTVREDAQKIVAHAGRPNDEKIVFGGTIKSRDIVRAGAADIPVPEGTAITIADEWRGSGQAQSVVSVAKNLKQKYPQWWADDAYDVLKQKYPSGMSEEDVRHEEMQLTGLRDQYSTAIENMQKLAMVGAAALLGADKKGGS